MKLDRRTFLEVVIGFSAGAGAGFMLTPVNWKVMDDMAIWSQELWPRYQLGGWKGELPSQGEVTFADTVCNLCPGGCGITVRKVKDRCTKIEGREGYPVNDGGICALGAAGLQLLYGPWRVPGPMKRAGERGSGKFDIISWDQAMTEVADKLSGLRDSGRAHNVACILDSDRGSVAQLFARFMKAYGSPNFIRTASSDDTYEMILRLMQGVDGLVGYDLEGADFILSFGSGIIEGWGSPVRSIQAHSKWRTGDLKKRATLVQVEPRLSNTAAKADQWIPVKPGTEGALALGLAHVIVQESLYDQEFVNYFAHGFEDWSDESGGTHTGFKRLITTEYSPRTVSGITGISADTIVKLARKFAGADHPLAVWGRGKGTVSGSLYECMAVHALNALVGNINKPGGVRSVPQTALQEWPAIYQDGAAWMGCREPRIDGAGSDRYPLTRYLPDRWAQVINDDQAQIDALLVHNGDPYFTTADSEAVAKAFKKIPFVVSFSSYFDETAFHADLLLPNHHYLERWEDFPTPRGFQKPVLGLLKPVVSPQFDTRHTGDVLIAMAKSLGSVVGDAFPWTDYEAALQEAMGDKWDALRKAGYVEQDGYEPLSWSHAFAGTPSGKFEFAITSLDRAGVKIKSDRDYLPHYEPVPAEGAPSAYPLVLIPTELMRLADGAIGNPPFCTKTLEESELKRNDLFVEVNPQTAVEHGLSEGKHATLSTPKGSAKVLVHLSEGIMPGVIGLPKGLGHAAYDDYLAGKGVNANSLLGVVEDPVSGLCATWGVRAKLTRV